MRDKLSINSDSTMMMTPRSDADNRRNAALREELRKGLSSLPEPKRDYDIAVPVMEEEEETSALPAGFVEDAADVDERTEAEREEARKAAWQRRSQVIQRSLPIPADINLAFLRAGESTNEEQIVSFFVRLVHIVLIFTRLTSL